MTELTDDYPEVFMNIEMNVVDYCQRHREIVDYHINKVYDGVQRTLEKELQGKNPPRLRWKGNEEELYNMVMGICEVMMGEGEPLETEDGEPIEIVEEPLPKELFVQVMKRLQSSVRLWNDSYGRRGYIDYITRMIVGAI